MIQVIKFCGTIKKIDCDAPYLLLQLQSFKINDLNECLPENTTTLRCFWDPENQKLQETLCNARVGDVIELTVNAYQDLFVIVAVKIISVSDVIVNLSTFVKQLLPSS